MPRVKRGVTARAKHKKVFEFTKGHRGRRKNVYTVAKNAVEKALTYAYRDRRTKKRSFRSLWILRINAAARQNGLSYSELIHKLKENKIDINRKVLADMAMNDSDKFSNLVKSLK